MLSVPAVTHHVSVSVTHIRVRSTRIVAAAAAAVLAVAMVAVIMRRPSSPGGDPDGRILAAVRPVTQAVPAGATAVRSQAQEPTYEKKCPDNPGGRSGWGYVIVDVTFRSADSKAAVIESVGRTLDAQGWQKVPVEWDHNAWQLPPMAEWAKPVAHGRTAHAALYQYPEGFGDAEGAWYLGANAKPPAFALAGC